MNLITFLSVSLLPGFIYIFLNPLQALTSIIAWNQRWRKYLEQKYGKQEFEKIAEEFRNQAALVGATPDEIEDILETQKSRITIRRGFEVVEIKF